MKVVINGMAAIEQKTGVGHYIERVHQEIASRSPSGNVRLFPGKMMRPIAAKLAPQSRKLAATSGEAKPGIRARISRIVKQSGRAAAQAYFTVYTSAQRFDLYHEPNYIPFRTSLPTVITAHDLSVLLHPEWHPAERVAIHQSKFRKAVEQAEHVITGSEQVKRELLTAIPLKREKVTAVYYGIGDEFRPLPIEEVNETRQRLNLPERFLLYVGAVEPRKNLLVALKAFCDLPASLRLQCPFLLAGPWAWKATDVADYFRDTAAPAGVRHLGYVSDSDRVALYNSASALVYPSRYEGFGLPPVEMLACGGGVLAGSAKAVVEVLGRHGHFIDPDDFVGWRDAMKAVAQNDDFLASSRRGGIAHANQYSWTRTAERTIQVYRKVLGLSVQETHLHRTAA